MKLFKGLLLGSAAALTSVVAAQAADLPANKSAPIEYVRVCDAYGAGFFYIPGTETCLRVGGLVAAETRAFNPSYSISGTSFYANGSAPTHALSGGATAGYGYIPSASQYSNQRSRDAYSFNALGRVELDARTKSDWGTVRTFLRVDSYYGSGGNSATGALNGLGQGVINTTAGTTVQRETTIVNKAFIQFAGLTAGRAQSMFDFYADAYNYDSLRGSNATVSMLAYTATFGGGFSATLSVEDQPSRRANVGSTFAGPLNAAGTAATAVTVGGITATSFQAQPAGSRIPEIVGNVRFDQPWGAVQLSAAAHQVAASLWGSGSLATSATSYAYPALTTNSYGFAVQAGVQLNMDYLSPGDKLWLQAAYERGAFGYIAGNNLGYNYGNGVNANRYAGSGFTPMDYSYGWNPNPGSDCVFTGYGPYAVGGGSCQLTSGWDVTGAYKHYWLPTLASAVYGSYMVYNNPQNALNGFGGAVGAANMKEGRVGTNLVWTPLKGFDIGTEFMYVHLTQSRPVGLASDTQLINAGLPAFKANSNEYEGRLRIQRAF
ncbi:porin [Methylocapsa acidiphila]|uniref:porin n=1 Tax=Methylocapsa acidiphila TaxID=133552 RepID=UPI0003F8488C|nr:porin [Methylocapsa acidiphila]